MELKVVIARDASRRTKELITAQFPDQWDCVFVPPDDLINHISDADVIMPEGAEIGDRVLKPARKVIAQEALPQAVATCEVVPSVLGRKIGDVASLMAALTSGVKGLEPRP